MIPDWFEQMHRQARADIAAAEARQAELMHRSRLEASTPSLTPGLDDATIAQNLPEAPKPGSQIASDTRTGSGGISGANDFAVERP